MSSSIASVMALLVGAILLSLEGDFLVIAGDETAVGNSDAMCVSGEIGKYDSRA